MKINFFITTLLLASQKALSIFLADTGSDEKTKSEKITGDIGEEFARHKANNPELFNYLKRIEKEGINKEQFKFLRDNYFVRTEGTFFSVMQSAMHIARQGNYELLPLVMRNAAEEGGAVDDKPHMALLEKAFNILGENVFGVKPKSLLEAKQSSNLVDEVVNFREKQNEIYKLSELENSNEEIIGRYYAHEKAAVKMLEAFKKIFTAYKSYFQEDTYKEMMEYFDSHIPENENGVEERHGSDAFLIVAATIYAALDDKIKAEKVVNQITKGGKEMLDAQNELWEAMLVRLGELHNSGERVAPKAKQCYSKDEYDIPKNTLSGSKRHDILISQKGSKSI